MKILLVTRGSQGDIYPYIALAKRLAKRSHDVLISVPFAFEKHVRDASLNYTLQQDDIVGMMDNSNLNFKDLLEWTKRVIKQQFDELTPLVPQYDVFLAANTEFAASTIAEYTKKRLIRTAYAPLLPSSKIMPPVTPLVNKNLFLRPCMIWAGVGAGVNMMSKKTLNKWRVEHGMDAIKNVTDHMPRYADNYLMYSPSLGEVDAGWKYRWHIGGYCFNDIIPYDDSMLTEFLYFVQKDKRPVLFFTLGSINGVEHDTLAKKLFEICRAHNYKMVVGCGWWEVGKNLDSEKKDDIFLLDKLIPHRLVMPHCTAIIHHGGSGTTHSASRAGKPQIVVPHVLDQYYWARRIKELGAGPGAIDGKKISDAALERAVVNLIENAAYRNAASVLGERIRSEHGLDNLVSYIENSA